MKNENAYIFGCLARQCDSDALCIFLDLSANTYLEEHVTHVANHAVGLAGASLRLEGPGQVRACGLVQEGQSLGHGQLLLTLTFDISLESLDDVKQQIS